MLRDMREGHAAAKALIPLSLIPEQLLRFIDVKEGHIFVVRIIHVSVISARFSSMYTSRSEVQRYREERRQSMGRGVAVLPSVRASSHVARRQKGLCNHKFS